MLKNKIKLICFDLDGVLCDSRDVHYNALNNALIDLDKKYFIERQEHISTYDGLSTKKKLVLLTEKKGLPPELYNQIWKRKQFYTETEIDKFNKDYRLMNILEILKNQEYKLAVVSNSIRKNIILILQKLGIYEYFSCIYSNEDVKNPKPSPEMYMRAMIEMNCGPKETLILEDSHIGRKGALDSGAYLCPITDPFDVTYEKIASYLSIYETDEKPKWQGGSMNVVIPMAGKGSRFTQAGYTFPKPLIPIHNMNGKPMIQMVVENLNVKAKFIYIVQKEHYDQYNLKTLLNLITPNCEIIQVDQVTEGAACTVLLAKHLINNDSQLFIANSDQFVEWDSNEFFYSMQGDSVDAGLATFYDTHPRWSFAKLDSDGFVSEVAEKNPISNIASTGFYWYKHGNDFVRNAEKMIEKNIRVNNEFYVCPVLNELIQEGKKVKVFNVKKMWGVGEPNDLKHFEQNYKP
jgi:HAD superfamily hydrolase (TIGR01509 family)